MNHSPPGGVQVIVPDDIDNPAFPSGGNAYDRRVLDALVGLGWTVREHLVPVGAPLGPVFDALPDGELVLVDGLLAPGVPVDRVGRLRLVVLAHMVFGAPEERAVLAAADAVLTTSEWCRRHLADAYGVVATAAAPGVEPQPVASPSATGDRLLCVAAVLPHKGQDVLADALAALPDAGWSMRCVGSLDRDPDFAAEVRGRAPAGMRFTGPLVGADLDAAYADTDLLVLPSRADSYGMVVTEALARGIPVLTTTAQGLPDTLGRAPDGSRPGVLVPPGDPGALAAALRRWLTEPSARDALRTSARLRRTTLTGWPVTAKLASDVLSTVAMRESTSR
ncbi:Glycosyltransferase involved in cell wall bisynthesis [Asanoa hainanensis]|uniref:Glycosyltransferase involved in cell wall bisynthesis n=1 Tax=Asanoa hainanensis TaxID=560556 RepID=A0A239JLG7_9ACTN|nr:glycosyltransferase family 4 protein [Asanoa hainanensis]SNT06697.1 Glycosyltransferase involved in cell wall bisynthesis [Asanoa hainanensis]